MQVTDALAPLVHVLGLRHKLVVGGMPYQPQISALDRGVDIARRHAGPPQRPDRARRGRPGRRHDRRPRRGRPHGRHGLPARGHRDPRPDPRGRAAAALLGDPRPGRRPAGRALPHRPGDPLDRRRPRPASRRWTHHVLLDRPAAQEGRSPPRSPTARAAPSSSSAPSSAPTASPSSCASRASSPPRCTAACNQGARNRVLGAFRTARLPVLVATDVAARGIHVDDVGVVAARRPAGRPQGLPAPRRPHRPRRRHGHGRHPRPAAPAPGHGAAGPRRRHRRRPLAHGAR